MVIKVGMKLYYDHPENLRVILRRSETGYATVSRTAPGRWRNNITKYAWADCAIDYTRRPELRQ